MKKKPNIVMFIPDSYRGDVLGHQGNRGALTPNLDALIRRGAVSYSRAFAQNPVCTPSRCSFMTGWYPHVHGHRSMRNMLKEHEPNLISVLRREGYHIWWGGKNDLFRVNQREDFLKYCDVKFYPEGKYADQMGGYGKLPPLAPDDPRRGAFYGGVLTRPQAPEKKDRPADPSEEDGKEIPRHYDGDTAWVLGAVDMIRNRPKDQPFFCFLPISKPHPAYYAEEDFYKAIDPDRLPPRIPQPGEESNLPKVLDALREGYRSDQITEEMWRDIKRIYYAMCAKVDDLFGKVVDVLVEQGLYDDTWILFFSDHGDFAGDYSLPEKAHSTLQDSLLRVPLVIKPPADVPVKPGVRGHLAELVDITATLYDLLGIEPGYTSQGVSLRNSLAGEETAVHDAVFAEVGGRKKEPGFFNTDVRGMAPDSFYFRQGQSAFHYHDIGSHAVMCRTLKYKYVRRYYTGHHELFDLEKDPDEVCNVSGRPEYAEVERRMQDRLLDFFMHTADVLPHELDSRKV